jgi:hypothetical protein
MTLHLSDMFVKSIDRQIDGVIKADDEAQLKTELTEYVITTEIAQRLESFLEAYNDYQTANGVWISGFFGSGKSHVLKMLALVLENRQIDGDKAYDLFRDKPEINDNPILRGALQKAVSIPSKSILFNIDQKADVISKTDVDALLSVFQKVFDEMCGYFGKQPHIAQFERDLDSRGAFDSFKQAFEAASGKPWERGRELALFEKANIAKAFASATGASEADAADILGHYRKDHRVSIEDFAETVKSWIDTQGQNFRLNFFVDEVGQYIADNVKLMTNLQTIAESLNTKCKGQAWIIVTAQQDMGSVIGDMTARQENDFSKIQARFSNRMPLNSKDVAEVIQRRLLAKTPDAQNLLNGIYDREENNLKTLFDFGDGSIRLKNFRDRDHFVSSYPFPAYQYDLFQMAITSLSEHNAFEGKHSSVGERSMLGVFQEVAKHMQTLEAGELATFDRMFEGLRSVLKSTVQQSIQMAERNLDDDFAVRVLKTLFLVKYVRGFKPTVRNIGILLLPDFETDLIEHHRKIEAALGALERETYIQRNGDFYEFLTNEERDVEEEIKHLDIDQSEVNKKLEELVFEQILRHRKIKHATTGYDYAFCRKLDDVLISREQELAINLISPFYPGDAPESMARTNSLTREELAIVLEQDARFQQDLRLTIRTEKFVKQARSGSPQPSRERIVSEKGEQNARRYRDLEARARKLISTAKFFVRGEELEIATEDAQDRIIRAFQTLIDKVYVNLMMLRGVQYTERHIDQLASPTDDPTLSGTVSITEPEQEILNRIQAQDRTGVKASAKALADHFSTKPYGWPPFATLALIAGLTAKGKIEARSDGSVLERAQLARALKNSSLLQNILLTPQVEFSPAQLRKAKDLYQEVFDEPCSGSDGRSIGAAWSNALDRLNSDLERMLAQQASYPFLNVLAPIQVQVKNLTGKPEAWYITDISTHEDRLLDAKEDVIDPIRRFMSGSQKGIYDDVRTFIRSHDANFSYVDENAASELKRKLADPTCFKGNAVQDLKADYHALQTEIAQQVQKEKQLLLDEIVGCREKLSQIADFQSLSRENQEKVLIRLEAKKDGVDQVHLIPELRNRVNDIRGHLLRDLLSEVDRLKSPSAPTLDAIPPGIENGSDHPAPGNAEPAPAPYNPSEAAWVQLQDLKTTFGKPVLSEEADVDVYCQELKKTLLAEIAKGKKVIL